METSAAALKKKPVSTTKKTDAEIFHERIKEGQYEREDVQKKSFGKWINSMLSKGNHPGVKDVFVDLKDGTVLLNLLEVLTKTQIKREKGRMRVHHLNNVSRALELLKEQKVRLVNISNNEIVDGNCKITLALCWSIFLHWQTNDIMKELMASTHQSNLEKALLQWCQQNTQPYPGVEIKNFSTCWSDGRAFAALVHRFRPDQVNYGSLANMNIMKRLESIFTTCEVELGIERLLDPEDVNTSVPDKKSVMMYVMCLFQALTQGSLEPPPLPQTIDLEASIESNSEAANTAAEESKEIASYNSIVEEVLGWLIQASDVVAKFPEVGDDLKTVKEIFHEHERFMLTLTEHQSDVGEVLQEGSRLLCELKLKPEEVEHVKLHMKILNDKWEELRIASMTRQNLIHEKLMTLQLTELNTLKEFLTKTEDDMSVISNMSFKLKEIEAKHQKMSRAIIEMQSRVISFSDLVLVVDSNSDSEQMGIGEDVSLEDQLQGLSVRWSVICSWAEKRGKLLGILQAKNDDWADTCARVLKWLETIEGQVKSWEALGDDHSVDVIQRYEALQRLQSEMEEKLNEINSLTQDTQEISQEFNDPYRTEYLMDKWEAISQILSAQSNRLSKYSHHQQKATTKRTEEDFMVDILQQVSSRSEDEPVAKRLKTKNWLQENKQLLNDWIGRTHGLIQQNTFDELSVEEQVVLYEDIDHEFTSNLAVYKKYVEACREVQQIDYDLESRWSQIETNLLSRKSTIDKLVREQLLRARLHDLSQTLQTYTTWLEANAHHRTNRSSTEMKVKIKTLTSHEPKVVELENMNKEKHDPEIEAVTKLYHDVLKKLQVHLTTLESMNLLSSQEQEEIHKESINQWSEKVSQIEQDCPPSDLESVSVKLKSLIDEYSQFDESSKENHEVKDTYEQIQQQLKEVQSSLASYNRWREKIESLESWLDQVNVFVVAETPAVGDIEVIEAQLEQSNALQNDIETLENSYTEIMNEGKGYSLKQMAIRARVLKLASTWTDTVRKAKEQNSLLNDCTVKTKSVTSLLTDLTSWLEKIKEAIDVDKDVSLETPIQLSRLTRKYRSINDQVEAKTGQLKEINELANDLLLVYNTSTSTSPLLAHPSQPGPLNLAKSITTINSHWNQITSTITQKFQQLRDTSNVYGEFRSLTAQMTDSLDRLERKIYEASGGDIEELSMHIDDLDNTIPSIRSRLNQIQELTSKLSTSGLSVTPDLGHLETRFEVLHDKYNEKRMCLELNMNDLSQIELCLMNCSKQLDTILHEFHDGLTNSASLETNLSTQLENLNKIQDQIKSSNINPETKTRLESQKSQISERLDNIKARLGEYDDLNIQLERMWQKLRNIQCSLAFLELGSDQIDDIDRQIIAVKREYATLRTLKSQLESILREGRRKSANDVKLNNQLDSIKGLYNQLGIQVSMIKSNLDNGLELSTKIHTSITFVKDFLEKVPDEVNDENLNNVRFILESLPNANHELQSITKNLDEYSKLIDPILIQDLTESVTELKESFESKANNLVTKYKESIQPTVVKEDEIQEDLEIGHKKLTDISDKIKSIYDPKVSVTTLVADLQSMSDQVESLRNKVIDHVTLNCDPFTSENEINVKFNQLYDQFNVLSRHIQTLENSEIHEDQEEDLDELPVTGIINPCFDDDEDSTVTFTIPTKANNYKVENYGNISYTVSKSSPDSSDEDDDISRATVIQANKEKPTQPAPPQQPPVPVQAPQVNKTSIVTVREQMEEKKEEELNEVDKYKKELQLGNRKLADISEKIKSMDCIYEPRIRVTVLDEILEEVESMILLMSHGDTLSLKVSKVNINDAQAVLGLVTNFKTEWTSVKTTAESLRMTSLWLESLLLEVELLSSAINPNDNSKETAIKKSQINSKLEQLRAHGISCDIPAFIQQGASPKVPEVKQTQKEDLHQEPVVPPKPARASSDDIEELKKLEKFIESNMESKMDTLEQLKKTEISISKMHRTTVRLLKNPNLSPTKLANLDDKWKKLLDHVAKCRAEHEQTSLKQALKPTLSSERLKTDAGSGGNLDANSPVRPQTEEPLLNNSKLNNLESPKESNLLVDDELGVPLKETNLPVDDFSVPLREKDRFGVVDVDIRQNYTKVENEQLSKVPSNENQVEETKFPIWKQQQQGGVESVVPEMPLKETSNLLQQFTKVPLKQEFVKSAEDVPVPTTEVPLPESSVDDIQKVPGVFDSLKSSSLRSWSRQDPVEALGKWIESVNECLNSKLDITDEQSLRNQLSSLKTFEHQIIGKRLDADKLLQNSTEGQVGSEKTKSLHRRIQECSTLIPSQRQLAEQKLASLRKLKLQLDTTASWILEIRAQLATAKHRQASERDIVIQSVLSRISDKEAEVQDVIRNYRNLQLETSNQGSTMDRHMTEKMRQLTEDWDFVLTQDKGSRRASFTKLANVSPDSLEEESSTAQDQPHQKEDQLEEGKSNSQVDNNEDLESVLNQRVDEQSNKMTLTLKQLKQQSLIVGDPEQCRFILEKQKNVQSELELKRPQLDELLMTAENLKSQENRTQLYAKLTRLMSHWSETNEAVSGRMNVLQECLHDSINWNRGLEHIRSFANKPELEDPQQNLEPYLAKLSDFLSLTSNLIVKYSSEDTSNLNAAILELQLARVQWKLARAEKATAISHEIVQDLEGELTSMDLQRTTSDEIKQRWNSLRNRVIAIRSKVSTVIGHHLPQSYKSVDTSIALRELTEWVITKEAQLPHINLKDDIHGVEAQINGLENFLEEIEIKRPIIESSIRQQQYGSKSEGKEQQQATAREIERLDENWNILLSKANHLLVTLQDCLHRQKRWNEELDDCSARLATAEAIKSRWSTITAAADKSTILDQLKTFREHMSSTNKAIQDLNNRYKALELPKEPQRLTDLNSRLQLLLQDSPVPLLQADYISWPWEKLHTHNGVPYYVNHNLLDTQWDHPSMTQLLTQLTDLNIIRFSAYRTALKLRAIQKHIQLDRISLSKLMATFETLGLRGTNDRLLDVQDMTFTIQTLHMNSESCSYITDMTVNWILNVYDERRTGSVRNLSFKTGLVLLCKGSMEDKFKYLFHLVADVNKTVDQRKLGLLLHDCMQSARVLGEVAAFGGSNIEPSVRSCFDRCGPGENLRMQQFIEWTKQEPQSLVWLPVLHRVAASEGQSHNAKCNVCKLVPIVGLRYRCLKCFNFDMCQKCFFSGKKSKSHKLNHPMQEYCIESTSGEDVRDFTKALRNRFKSKRRLEKGRKLGYLPVQSLLEGDTFESPSHSPQHSLSPELSTHRLIDNLTSQRIPNIAETEMIMNNNRTLHLHNQTPESDDEHTLIAAYCQSLSKPSTQIPRSPIQVLSSIDADHSIQLESVIRSLEAENNSLQQEYNRLLKKTTNSATGGNIINNIENNNILNEARLLRAHKGRLEARMQILEDHNRQLEGQLNRLRQLLDEPNKSENRTGTLQSKAVVASELDINSPNFKSQLGEHKNSSQYSSYQQQQQPVSSPPSSEQQQPKKLHSEDHPEDIIQRSSPPTYQKTTNVVVSPQQQQPPSHHQPPHQAVEDLLTRASEIGKTVGALVNTLTDEED